MLKNVRLNDFNIFIDIVIINDYNVNERTVAIMNNKRITMLRKEQQLTQAQLAQKLGVGRTTVNGYEQGIIAPPPDKIKMMSEIFDVTTDYLIGKSDDRLLTVKDNNDIAEKMKDLLQTIELSQNDLTFNGQELDDITRQLLIQSLHNSLEIGKTISKAKYTPNKYRKE